MPGFRLDKVRLPEVSFGQAGELPSHWDKVKDEDPHCRDEEPKQFPSDVAALLGFDPTEEMQSNAEDKSWIGVDLDGTLAQYHTGDGVESIGAPIPRMVNRVKKWLAQGKKVKIFTARVAHDPGNKQKKMIRAWTKKYLGQVLEVTHQKDPHMIELWDDRAVRVKKNKGIRAGGPGSGRHPEVSKAIDEIHEKFPAHPANPDERALMVQGKPAVGFQVAEREGRLRLKTIHSDEPKSGAGALVMRRLTKIADKHGATMELTSAPYGEEKGRISHEKLQAFYEGHGFKLEKGYDPALGYMVREPKKAVNAGGPGSGRHPEGGTKYKLPAGLPKVFAKMLLPKNATWQRHQDWKKQAYGGVLVNRRGQFLLREPYKHFDGYHWTFPKGKMDHEKEHPVDVALREVQEETGRHGRILDTLPGNYQTKNSNSNFFVMRSLGNDPSKMDKETWRTHWADYEEAKQLISRSKNELGRNRDLAILDQAHEHLQRYKR